MSDSNNGPCPTSVNAPIFKKYTEAGLRLDNTNLFRSVMVMFLGKKFCVMIFNKYIFYLILELRTFGNWYHPKFY